ncbi:sensor domain-containing protein [Sporosarcina sp. CAU 1771]
MNSDNSQNDLDQPDILKSLGEFYMVTHTDSDGVITFTNNEFLKISKWTPKRILGKTFWQMFPNVDESQNQAHTIWKTILSGNTWAGSVEKLSRSGEHYFVKMIAIPTLNTERTLSSVIFLELDITEDVQLRKQLQEIAFIDHETGLMSRHKLEVTVNDFIENNKSFSFVYISIDHFYTLKDLQTHGSEKEFIQSFSNRLKRFFKDDPIARIGVNDFVVVTAFGDWYIQGFLDFLEQHPIYIENTALKLSISGGIVRHPEDQETYTHLMKAALSTLKDVAENGGGKIASLSAQSHKELNRKAIIDRKLLTALDNENLQVYYQPQMDLSSGKILLYEALVRWEDDELGHVTPDELIPIAEENGLIHNIGSFVLEESAKLANTLSTKKQPVSIAVNSSVREFTNPNLRTEILEILNRTGCPASHLELEITENFAFQAEEQSSIFRQMKELHDSGIKFALDDFGTGYASFRYMQSLPITKIKIDKIFIKSLLTHPKTQQLVEGMIHFGKSMGMYVVAEGVETEEQFNALKAMNVDAVQGYYIGAPVTADAIPFVE